MIGVYAAVYIGLGAGASYDDSVDAAGRSIQVTNDSGILAVLATVAVAAALATLLLTAVSRSWRTPGTWLADRR